MKREIKEEIGCDIEEYKYFKSYFYDVSDDFAVRTNYYFGKILGDIVLQKSELSEYGWFNFDGLNDLNIAYNHRDVLREFFESEIGKFSIR